MRNRYYDKQALESSFGGFQGSTPFMFDGSLPGQPGRVIPGRHRTVDIVRNIFNSSPDKARNILKRYPVASGAVGLASFAGLGYGAAALADRYASDRKAGYSIGNPYLDKQAISQGMLFWKGLKRPFTEFKTNRMNIASGAWRRMEEVRNQKLRGMANAAGRFGIRPDVNYLKEVVSPGMQDLRALRNIQNVPSYLGALKQSYQASPAAYRAGMLSVPAAAGAAGITGIGYAAMPEEEAWYDRFAGYSQENPYIDKISKLKGIYGELMNDRFDPSFRIVAGMPSGTQDPVEYYAQAMQKDPTGRDIIDSTTRPSILNRIVSGGLGALGGGLLGGVAASAIAGRPGFFGPSDTDKNIIAGGLLAGALGGGYAGQKYLAPVFSRSEANNHLLRYADGGINDQLRYMSEKDAEYRRLKKVRDRMMDIAYHNKMSIYAGHNPYLDKIAVSQALYNSAVKKRLMNQIMGYGTNPSRTVNLPVIQNNMRNAIMKNRDMSTLRAVTSGPVSGQDGYSGLFRNINIRNNAARNTANLTAEALREMPWYMRPLAMVS